MPSPSETYFTCSMGTTIYPSIPHIRTPPGRFVTTPPCRDKLLSAARDLSPEECDLFEADARTVLLNGQDFEARSARINETTSKLVRPPYALRSWPGSCRKALEAHRPFLACHTSITKADRGSSIVEPALHRFDHHPSHSPYCLPFCPKRYHQVEWLEVQPGVRAVYYPRLTQRRIYDMVRRPEGGYGGLFSLTLEEGLSPMAFYDALDVFKGPSLGTNFTLACPYTILVGRGL